MQNNRHDDLRTQTSKLQNSSTARPPYNSAQNISPLNNAPNTSPQRIYPNAKPRTPPNYRPQNEQKRSTVYDSGKTQVIRVHPDKPVQRSKAPLQKKQKHSKFLDFLFGFVIGLAVFGTAAVFVVRSVLEIFI